MRTFNYFVAGTVMSSAIWLVYVLFLLVHLKKQSDKIVMLSELVRALKGGGYE